MSYKGPDAPFVATPPEVAEAMLDMVEMKKGETVLVLGCGEGNIVLPAAKRGAYVIGVEKDQILRTAIFRAKEAGLESRITFLYCRLEDYLSKNSLKKIDVVATFLYTHINKFIAPFLEKGLPNHARVVSNDYEFPWKESEKKEFTTSRGAEYDIFLYRMTDVRKKRR